MAAATETHSPVILSVSESALKYMGDETVIALVKSQISNSPTLQLSLHLDHGATFEICKHAIDIGFSSVMIDASNRELDENIEITN